MKMIIEIIIKILNELMTYKVIAGISLGILSGILIDVKNQFNSYYNELTPFYEFVEELYIKIRFHNLDIENYVNKITKDENFIKVLPNYFRYAIYKKEYDRIEAIIVITYLSKINRNYNFISNKYINIFSMLFINILSICLFIISLIGIPSFIISSVYEEIYKKITITANIDLIYLCMALLVIAVLFYVIFISPIFVRKFLDNILNYNYIKDLEEDYERVLNKFVEKYNNLKKKNYKLHLDREHKESEGE